MTTVQQNVIFYSVLEKKENEIITADVHHEEEDVKKKNELKKLVSLRLLLGWLIVCFDSPDQKKIVSIIFKIPGIQTVSVTTVGEAHFNCKPIGVTMAILPE